MALFSRRGKRGDKARADELFAAGHWDPALTAYEALLRSDAENVKLLRRVADLRVKLGRKAAAAEAYRKVADLYAEGGFLVQAIAIHKILLRIDPGAEDLGSKLADLYAKRGITAAPGITAEIEHGGAGGQGLPDIPLFSDLEGEAFQEVVARLVPRALSAGEVLFREGDPGESIFVVTSGTLRVARGELFLAELAEGAFLGEGAFFSQERRNADVVAIGDCELLEIRRDDMEELMERYPGVEEALSEFYRQRVLDGVLAATPLFRNLDENARKRIAERFELLTVDAGEVVVREGETDRSLYLIKRGCFAVTTTLPGDETPRDLARLGPTEFFGEVALVGSTPRTATVRSIDRGEVLRVRGEDLDPVLDEYPELRRMLEDSRDQRAIDAVSKLLGRKQ